MQRSGGAHEAGGGPGTHAEPGPQPGSGGAGLNTLLSPGGSPGVHGGQGSQPLAFEAVQQPPQRHDPFGQGVVGQPVQVLVDQLVDHRRQRPQPCGALLECVFDSMAGTYQAPTRTQAPNPNLGTTFPQRLLLVDEH